MTASLLIPPRAKFWNTDGTPLASGKVYTYEAGTLSNKVSYQTYDTAGAQNTNPVILNSVGEADIWLDGNYKINVTDADDVQLSGYPVDNVSSFAASNNFYETTGTVNTYTLSPSPSILSYSAGDTYNVIFNIANTGPSTINISNLGVKSLVYPPDSPLSSGNLLTSVVYQIVYDGTNFQVLNPTTLASSPPTFIQMGFQSSAPTGYLLMNGDTIAKTSGGTFNGLEYETLFTYLWNNTSDSVSPVSSGRGSTAAADFAANKTITIPDRRDYSPFGVSASGSITEAGATAGATTVASAGTNSSSTTGATTLSTSQMPAHTHDVSIQTGGDGGTTKVGGAAKVTTTVISAAATSTGGGGSHTHSVPGLTYTGSATSVLHKVFGVYWYISI